MCQKLVQADVIYLGENHNRAADHQAELEIIRELHQRHPKIAITMEMFQRPYSVKYQLRPFEAFNCSSN
ncbi:MAG: ChaN family lipoprotein [Chroococcidiopsidaceae cyanobacterium CP_BM_RX_35]|nr:ChaN family lipoprotein [Chroococcidiopsidaceae cyanobacterium CP_BM_RX_35]